MKVAFFSINFILGAAALVIGFTVLLSAMSRHSFSAVIVGSVIVGLAAICLGFCKDCLTDKLKKHFKAGRVESA